MSTPTNDYQGCLQALSKAVGESVAATQAACFGNSKETADDLKSQMRRHYTQHVKPLFEHKKADEVLERDLGTAFGALITHLLALQASWRVFGEANNKLIDLTVIALDISNQAIKAGQTCYGAAVDAVSHAMMTEATIRAKAETFVAMVKEEVRRTDRLYNSNPHSAYSTGYRTGYSPMCIYIAEQSRKRILFQFDYWDGVDACYVALGYLYPKPEDQKVLIDLATRAFGAPVRFAENNSVIEIDEAAA